MDVLKFSLKEIPAQGLPIALDVPVRAVQPPQVEALPVETAHFAGVLTEAGGDYLFRGHLTGVFQQCCDRCLEPLSMPFDVELVWTFEEGPPLEVQESGWDRDALEAAALAEEGAVRRYQGMAIDMTPYLWEELALALPAKFVCDLTDMETCPYYNAPLDATSGGDGAGDAPPQSQFAVLKDLLPELEQKEMKE